MDQDALIDRLRTALVAQGTDISAAYLFGSWARGSQRDDSDVDVAVLFESSRPRTLLGLPTELEATLGRACGREVQVVDLERAPVDLVHRVLRDGVLLVERDRSARIRFEVHRRNQYFDLLPHLERYRGRVA